MFAYLVQTDRPQDYYKSLQKANLTAWQPCKVPVTSYI